MRKLPVALSTTNATICRRRYISADEKIKIGGLTHLPSEELGSKGVAEGFDQANEVSPSVLFVVPTMPFRS